MTERTLIVTAFEFAKGIAELKLTEDQLGLFSAFVLFDPSKFLSDTLRILLTIS